jgi:uncharacterized protein
VNYLEFLLQLRTEYYILVFIVYSFIGWVTESLFRSIIEKGRLINSGFLFGPFIPVYGFGAIFILLIEFYVKDFLFPIQILIFSIIATVLEYLTSYIFEKKLSMRLWDYSNHFLNIKGRVCPLFSSFWAFLSAIQITYIHSVVDKSIQSIPPELQIYLSMIFFSYLSFDIFYSTRLYLRFTGFLLNLKGLRTNKISMELRKRLQNAHPKTELRRFLRPLQVFPYLREEFSESMLKLPSLSEIPYLNNLRNAINRRIETFSLEKNGVDMMEFKNICHDIIDNPEYQKLKEIKHHDKDIYSHNLKVAWVSYLTAKKLKLHVKEMVRGALLHDFFLYDWRVKGAKDEFLPHGFTHPFVARKNSERVFGHLTPIEMDIIIKHMWPLTIVPPRYPESFLVSFIDKFIASKEVTNIILSGKKRSEIDGEEI